MSADVSQLQRIDLVHAAWSVVAVWLILGPVAWLRVRHLRTPDAENPAGRAPIVAWQFKRTHVLPATIQLALFVYWGVYYRSLASHVPGIAVQLALAFSLDALLAWARHGRWRATLGSVPLVFSLNLFAIFLHGELYMSLAAVVAAVASKHFLRRTADNGTSAHVFNPSGFGIAAVAVFNIVWPALGDGDIAHEFNLPPNMAELIVLLALIVQSRVPVVLVTIGATAAMMVVAVVTGYGGFAPQWAPVTLVIVLLMTDPATTSRSAGGKLLFGLLAGLLMQAMAWTLPDHPDFFYAKVLPIPLCNLAAPTCDRLAAHISERFALFTGLLDRRHNRVHIAIWLLCFTALVGLDKRPQMGPGHPEPELHAFNRTPLVVIGRGGEVHCDENPTFCAPFSFLQELQMWVDTKRSQPNR